MSYLLGAVTCVDVVLLQRWAATWSASVSFRSVLLQSSCVWQLAEAAAPRATGSGPANASTTLSWNPVLMAQNK